MRVLAGEVWWSTPAASRQSREVWQSRLHPRQGDDLLWETLLGGKKLQHLNFYYLPPHLLKRHAAKWLMVGCKTNRKKAHFRYFQFSAEEGFTSEIKTPCGYKIPIWSLHDKTGLMGSQNITTLPYPNTFHRIRKVYCDHKWPKCWACPSSLYMISVWLYKHFLLPVNRWRWAGRRTGTSGWPDNPSTGRGRLKWTQTTDTGSSAWETSELTSELLS